MIRVLRGRVTPEELEAVLSLPEREPVLGEGHSPLDLEIRAKTGLDTFVSPHATPLHDSDLDDLDGPDPEVAT